MTRMAPATPKGLARRQLLAEAAGAILTEYGHEAVRHRAVAQEAGLPLASTTYYFNSLTDLLRAAVQYTCEVDATAMEQRCCALPECARSARDTADAIAGVLVGDWSTTRLVTRCELFVLAVRHPEFAEIVTQRHDQVASVVAQVLAKSKRHHSVEQVHKLVAFEDGALLEWISLGDQAPADPAGCVADAIVEVVDILAPALEPVATSCN